MLQSLLGAWRLTKSVMTDLTGVVLNPLTEWEGLIIYTETGDVAVQLSSCSHIAHLEPRDVEVHKKLEQGPITLLSNYSSYYGKYEFDLHTQRVTHRVHNSNVQTIIGKTIQRQVTVYAPDLISLKLIEPEQYATDKPIYWELFWQRMSSL